MKDTRPRCPDCGARVPTVEELRKGAARMRRGADPAKPAGRALLGGAKILEASADAGPDARGVTRHARAPEHLVLCEAAPAP